MTETYYVRLSADAGVRGTVLSAENAGARDAGSAEAEGIVVPVVVSDEPWKGDLAVTGPEAVTERRLQDAARRKLGLPLIIAETERLFLREFTEADLPALRGFEISETELKLLGADAGQFCDAEFLKSYINNQYPLWGFGIWGVFLRKNGRLIGMAGFSMPEEEEAPENGQRREPDRAEAPGLGYYIAPEYRRQGLAEEACTVCLRYAEEELGFPEVTIRVRQDNAASLALAGKLAERAGSALNLSLLYFTGEKL